jgi:flavin reductase (DIM6/NTAB) family NADH-FMN oxidoreductase RutF
VELDLEGKHADRAYAMLVSLVTPRPIAWVTTLNENGKVNAAPFSFFNAFGANPPIIGVAPGNRDDGTPKDTAINIRRDHEFVVNLVDEELAEAMNRTSASLPYGVGELEGAGLSATPSSSVKPPRITQAPASLECAEWGTLQIGDNRLVSAWSSASMCATSFSILRRCAFAASASMSSGEWRARTAAPGIASRWCGRGSDVSHQGPSPTGFADRCAVRFPNCRAIFCCRSEWTEPRY